MAIAADQIHACAGRFWIYRELHAWEQSWCAVACSSRTENVFPVVGCTGSRRCPVTLFHTRVPAERSCCRQSCCVHVEKDCSSNRWKTSGKDEKNLTALRRWCCTKRGNIVGSAEIGNCESLSAKQNTIIVAGLLLPNTIVAVTRP